MHENEVLTSKMRFPVLDGLRGIAVLLVIAFHYLVADFRSDSAGMYYSVWFFQVGWTGVDLFFVLSGFLIGGILFDYRQSRNLLKAFYIRRAFRIVPLYLLTLCCYILGVYLFDQRTRTNFVLPFLNHGPLWPFTTFTQNYWMALSHNWGCAFNGVTWSLAIEEHFYLVLPLLVLLLPYRLLPAVFVAAIALSLGFRFSMPGEEGYMRAYLMTHARLDGLCMGALTAWLLRCPGVWERARGMTMLRYVLALSTVVTLIWFVQFASPVQSPFLTVIKYLWFAAFYALILLHAISFQTGVLGRMLSWGPLRFVGRLSFCLYLIHQAVNVLAYAYLRNKLPAIEQPADLQAPAVALVASLAIAYLSGRFFEGPLLKVGHRYNYESNVEAPIAAVPLH